MLEISIYNAKKHFGENFILDNATFYAYEGDKIGLIGDNGSGKTTILKLLAGIETMDIDYRQIREGRSRISIPKGTKIGYLEQISDFSEGATVQDVLNLAFTELYDIEKRMEVLETEMGVVQGEELDLVFKRYSRLQQDYSTKGGYEKAEKLSKICTGLKFDENFLKKQMSILSGGEKNIVCLGKLLLESPDLLLLDEPTNHLDLEAVQWLEKYLKSQKGIVIVVSHDRYFMDNLVNKIVELENRSCEIYETNYSGYVKKKEENLLLQLEKYNEQKKAMNSLENSIKELRAWAQQADNNKFYRRAVSMQRKLEKMSQIKKPVLDKKNIKFDLRTSEHMSYEVLRATGISKSFDGKELIRNVNLHIVSGESVALIGLNGSGKSTLVKMIMGQLTPDKGQLKLGVNLRIAYLPQNITFDNSEETIIECFREGRVILEGKAREYLSKYLFYGRDAYKRVKNLSGGEKVRLKLAMLLFDKTDFLVMDEPTNHLDIESIEALEEALENFKGTILFISHDRYFINKISNRVLEIENQSLFDYKGNFHYYKEMKAKSF